MIPLRDVPIQRKLTTVILLASTVTLFLASSSMLVWQWFHTRTSILYDLTTQARILAANCTASVAFSDAGTAAELLSALKANPNLVHARLIRDDGSLFAEYVAIGHVDLHHNPDLREGHAFSGRYLVVAEPLFLDGKMLARLHLQFAFSETRRQILAPYFGITAAIFAANFLLAILLSARLQRLISHPILKLAEVAVRVAEKEDYSVRATPFGRDELGRLTLAFNTMLSRIEAGDTALRAANAELAGEMAERARLSRELIEFSRRAGMAEVATGVLHNVGNALNSITVAATLVQDQLAASRLRDLLRAVDLIRTHQADFGSFVTSHPQGRHLPAFLVELSSLLDAEHETWRRELSGLARNIEHVKEIVAAQQSYGRVAGVIERLPPHELVEDALRLNKPALDRLGVVPQCRFEPVPHIFADKHKLLQILVNLVKNSVAALKPMPAESRRLILSIKPAPAGRITIEVADTGIGIPPENLPRIFTHGFTTRSDGHGFGLHASALAVRELEGAISVQSGGPGCGATFVVEIPRRPSSHLSHDNE